MDNFYHAIAVLGTAFLFGGMLLFSLGFAPFLFSVLPPETARLCIRKIFPHFYSFVIAIGLVAGASAVAIDATSAVYMMLVVVTAFAARQVLMPAINAATDQGKTQKFKYLHALSVVLTLAHIGVSGFVLMALSGQR
jgi:hypothetical protein